MFLVVLPFGQAVFHLVLTSALPDVSPGNNGSSINPLGLDICFDEYTHRGIWLFIECHTAHWPMRTFATPRFSPQIIFAFIAFRQPALNVKQQRVIKCNYVNLPVTGCFLVLFITEFLMVKQIIKRSLIVTLRWNYKQQYVIAIRNRTLIIEVRNHFSLLSLERN